MFPGIPLLQGQARRDDRLRALPVRCQAIAALPVPPPRPSWRLGASSLQPVQDRVTTRQRPINALVPAGDIGFRRSAPFGALSGSRRMQWLPRTAQVSTTQGPGAPRFVGRTLWWATFCWTETFGGPRFVSIHAFRCAPVLHPQPRKRQGQLQPARNDSNLEMHKKNIAVPTMHRPEQQPARNDSNREQKTQ